MGSVCLACRALTSVLKHGATFARVDKRIATRLRFELLARSQDAAGSETCLTCVEVVVALLGVVRGVPVQPGQRSCQDGDLLARVISHHPDFQADCCRLRPQLDLRDRHELHLFGVEAEEACIQEWERLQQQLLCSHSRLHHAGLKTTLRGS